MSQPWFFCEEDFTEGLFYSLSASESQHAKSAKRLREGDSLQLCNGKGYLANAIVARIERRSFLVEVKSISKAKDLAPKISLFCALPKGDRCSQLLNMATQLGMAQFTPLECERSVSHAKEETPERWIKISQEACKQSQRAFFPHFTPPQNFSRAIKSSTDNAESFTILLDPDATNLHTILEERALELKNKQSWQIFIGPEGGFSEKELKLARNLEGCNLAALGTGILRIETAALSATSMLDCFRAKQ